MTGLYGRSLADSSFSTNEGYRLRFVEGSSIGKARITRLTRAQVVEWITALPGKPRTVRRVVAFASKLMSLAQDQGYRADNPFARISSYLPRVDDRENRVLSLAEASTLRNLAPERRIDAMILVALMTGLRRGELIRLQWGNLSGDMLSVPGTKTAKSKRILKLSSGVVDLLTSQPKRGLWIFSTENGLQLSPRNLTRDFAARREALGIPPETRLQDLRGTFATLMIGQEGLKETMDLTGHAKAETLMRSYVMAQASRTESAITKLDRKLLPKPKRAKVENG